MVCFGRRFDSTQRHLNGGSYSMDIKNKAIEQWRIRLWPNPFGQRLARAIQRYFLLYEHAHLRRSRTETLVMESVPPACDRGANSKEALKVSQIRQEKADFQSSQTARNPAYPDEPPSETSFRNYTGTNCIYLKALIRQRISLRKGSVPPTILGENQFNFPKPFPKLDKNGPIEATWPGRP